MSKVIIDINLQVIFKENNKIINKLYMHHIFLNEILKLEHNLLSGEYGCTRPGWEGIFGSLNC